MDNHPIPQDITGFKFKLVGKMTVKQFVYLAAGAGVAWLFFFVLPLPALVKWPVSIIAVVTGAMFAFIPIDGRPMDQMLGNFIKAIISPVSYVYKKDDIVPAESPIPVRATQKALPTQTPSNPTIQQAVAAPAPAPQPTTPAPSPVQPAPTPAPPPVVFPEEKEKVQPTPTPAPQKQADTGNQRDLENMLVESQRQKEALEKQILEMQAKQEVANKNKVAPTVAKNETQTQKVRTVPTTAQNATPTAGMPEAPNLITGFVKDPRGNPLQNIIIEVMDQDSNPVRAFKTNSLGKFASATSLSNGKYTITFEDPAEKHKFDAVEMSLVGSSVMPLEVTSVDSREELRRELFN